MGHEVENLMKSGVSRCRTEGCKYFDQLEVGQKQVFIRQGKEVSMQATILLQKQTENGDTGFGNQEIY